MRKSSRKADRVVKHKLADGTFREYRYPPYRPKRRKARGDTVGDLIASWERSPEWQALSPRTRAGYSIYLRPLMGIQHVAIDRVERRDLIEIRNAIATARGRGAATGFIRTACSLFGWGVENGWLKHSPAIRIKRLEGGHLPAWTPEDAERAIATLPEQLRRAVVLALYTGQRRGDLIALPWSAYDGNKIRLRQNKTSAPLVITCPDELRAELDTWKRQATATLILTNSNGLPWEATNLSKRLETALARIEGFPLGRNIHGLRKLAAANLAQAGCTLHEIAAITGHKSLGMLQLYTASVDQERLAEAAIFRLGTKRKKAP